MSVLDKYRKAQEDAVKIETLEGVPYKAFDVAATSQRRLDLRPALKAQRIVSYAYMTDVIHAGGVIVGMSFSVPKLSVQLQGKNLQALVDGLREDKVTFIQEFSSTRHLKPAEGEPIITKMQITGPAVTPPKPKPATH